MRTGPLLSAPEFRMQVLFESVPMICVVISGIISKTSEDPIRPEELIALGYVQRRALLGYSKRACSVPSL